MLRLRKLEETGIVEHEKRQDRREVWYKLTQAGYDLRPVVEALAQWGLRYVMGPPLPGEMVHPESAVNIFKESLNNRGKKLAQPATWLLKFAPGGQFSLFFDGDRWSVNGAGEKNPDVIVTTTPEMWATFLSARRSERGRLARALRIDGAPVSVREFLYTLGVPVSYTHLTLPTIYSV